MHKSRRDLLCGLTAASLIFLFHTGRSGTERYLVHILVTPEDRIVADVLRRSTRIGLETSDDRVRDLYVESVDGDPIGLWDESRQYFVLHNFSWDWKNKALLSTQPVSPGDIVSVGIRFA